MTIGSSFSSRTEDQPLVGILFYSPQLKGRISIKLTTLHVAEAETAKQQL